MRMIVFQFTLLFALILASVSATKATVTIYDNRAAFVNASSNLHTIDFEDQPLSYRPGPIILDGIVFDNNNTGPMGISKDKLPSKVLFSGGPGEFTELTIFIPPGTTAVGLDSLGGQWRVTLSTRDSFTIEGSRFVGFTSDVPIRSLRFFASDTLFMGAPAWAYIDNLMFGIAKMGAQPLSPTLLTVEGQDRAIALDSVMMMTGPFSILSTNNFSSDRHTRISLFAVNVVLPPGSNTSAVTAQAEDSQSRIYSLPVEAVGNVYNLSWLTQVSIKLTDELRNAGEVKVSISVNGAVSNKVSVSIQP